MSQPIVLKATHRLGVEGIKRRLDERYETLKATVKLDGVAHSEMHWDGDTAHVSVKALGQRVTATIDVADHDLTITIRLPMILAPFKGAIVAFLERNENAIKG